MTKITSSQFHQAANAYNKALTNSKGITPSKTEPIKAAEPLNILRTGDVIDVVAKRNENSFPNIVNGILAPQVKKIQEGEVKTKKAIKSQEDLIEVMAAVNSAETALDVVITVRDKLINAYQEILKMPL